MSEGSDEGGPALTPGGVRERLVSLADPHGLLQAIVASAPVGLQLYSREGRCVLVNDAHTRLFGAVPPPEYNIFQDTVLIERGVADLVRRAFAGEHISVPPLWYDARELRNVAVSEGRRVAVGAEVVPLRDSDGAVEHVLFVFHDLTEAHLAREQAEAAARVAEQARAQAEATAHHSAFLAEAGRMLSASLDYEATLRQIAQLATPRLADFCIVDVLDEDGSLRRVAAVHADPEAQPALDELCRRFPPQPGSPQPAARVVESGRYDLLPEVDLDVLTSRTRGPEHVALMRRLGLRSHLAVPMQLGARTLGVISLGSASERRYSTADVPTAEALAGRAAVAIDNARLYRDVNAARAEAEAANRAKDEFLAMLGHELRNPLAPIVTALELTRKREGPSRERT